MRRGRWPDLGPVLPARRAPAMEAIGFSTGAMAVAARAVGGELRAAGWTLGSAGSCALPSTLARRLSREGVYVIEAKGRLRS